MGETGREKERRPPDDGLGSPPPTGGDEEGEAPASAEDLALWIRWSEGPDAMLARIGRAGLAGAGVMPGAIAGLSGFGIQIDHSPAGEPSEVQPRIDAGRAAPAPDQVELSGYGIQIDKAPLPPSGGVGIGHVGPGHAVIGDLPVQDAGHVLGDRPVAAVGLHEDRSKRSSGR